VVFGLQLLSHLPGFTVMTAFAAAAALGLVLATLARTGAQPSGFSTILILTMSALGGSMLAWRPGSGLAISNRQSAVRCSHHETSTRKLP